MDKKKLKNLLDENISDYFAETNTSYGSERTLFNFLVDHPDCRDGIEKIRKSLHIPKGGFSSQQSAFEWEHKRKENKRKLNAKVEAFLADFNIPQIFYSRTVSFLYDRILFSEKTDLILSSGKEAKESTNRPVQNIRVIRTVKNREYNKYLIDPESVYIQISGTVRLRDLEKAYKEIKKLKKDMRPFSAYRPQEVARTVWRLNKQEGARPNEIIELFKQAGKKMNHHDIVVYRNRYKKELEKLKRFSKKKK